jgi:hypothetical protein
MSLFRNRHDNVRDLVVVTGCNAVGKTTASNYLQNWATLHKIPHEDIIVADSQCLFEAMQSDDEAGGFHHTHDWCQPDARYHFHDSFQPEFPFTVTDNKLPNIMRNRFFTKLISLRRSDKLWFAEWAAGVNTNPLDDPASVIDYSYVKVKSMLREKSIPDGWLKRVKAIIHITATDCVRFDLNQRRLVPSSARPEAIENGTAFWQKDERVLRFYGHDDFSKIESELKAAGIFIYTIENDGGDNFYKNLELKVNEIFETEKATVGKLQPNMAPATKHSFIFLRIWLWHKLTSLRHTKSSNQRDKLPVSAETGSLTEEEVSV